MPAKTQYPNGEDLETFLTAAGFSSTRLATLDLESGAAAGVATFEQATGRRMLAISETREFDLPEHPRAILDLRADLASLTTVAVSGTGQTLGTDVRLLPVNAADRGRPYRMLQFARRFYPVATYPQPSWGAVAVTGLWGYGTTIPEDAWLAMLALGALQLHPLLAQAELGGLESWTEGDVTERYGSDPLGSLRVNWTTIAYGAEKLMGRGGIVGLYRDVAWGAG
jgi:hypothetical protein